MSDPNEPKKCGGGRIRPRTGRGKEKTWEGSLVKQARRSQQPFVWRRKEQHRKRNLNGDREVLSAVSGYIIIKARPINIKQKS